MTTQPPVTRDTARARLISARATLDTLLTAVSEAALARRQATHEWTALDLLRHIWVWNELCARCLDDWLGSRDWIITFADEDQFNLEMVAARANTSLKQIMAGLQGAYARYDQALDECSDAQLAERAPAPWGQRLSRAELIWFELGHDLTHMGQLQELFSSQPVK